MDLTLILNIAVGVTVALIVVGVVKKYILANL